jgi:hypothetical protein
VSFASNNVVNIGINFKDFPKIGQSVGGNAVITASGALFFFAAQMVIFISLLNTMV